MYKDLSPTVTHTWHVCKYKEHILHQRYILQIFRFMCKWLTTLKFMPGNIKFHVQIPGNGNLPLQMPGNIKFHVQMPGNTEGCVQTPGNIKVHVQIAGNIKARAQTPAFLCLQLCLKCCLSRRGLDAAVP